MMSEYSVIAGSILDLSPTPGVIVSSDDNHLSHGGGVSRAIWKKAGDELDAEIARVEPRLTLGDVFVTGAYGTGARHIFHAISIDFDLYSRLEPADVRPLLVKVLARAIDLNLASIALPMIGCGAGRLTPAAFLQEAEILASEWICIPCPVKAITIVDPRVPAGSEQRTPKTHAFAEDLAAASPGGSSLGKYLASLAQATAVFFLQGFAALEAQLDLAANDRPENAPRPSMPNDMIALVERSLRRELRQDERMLLQTARKYRNQFAHLGDETNDLDFLLAANRVARGFGKMLCEAITIPEDKCVVHPGEAESPAYRWLSTALAWATTPPIVGSVVAPPTRGGSAPASNADLGNANTTFSLKEQLASQDDSVRKLKSLIQSQMDKDDLLALRQRLIEQDGYAGDDDAILLEFCVRESPPEVLKELSRGRRLAVLEKLGGADGPATRDIDDQILERLGFTVRCERRLKSAARGGRKLQRWGWVESTPG